MRLGIKWVGLSLIVTAGILATGLMVAPRFADAAKAKKEKKSILVVTVTKGFRHDSIPVAEETLKAVGEKAEAWETDYVRNDDEMKAKMTASGLKKYAAIVFANTTGVLPLPDPQAFLDYIKNGGGFVAMHSGSDTFHEWPGSSDKVSPYIQMLGGEFRTHHAQCAVDCIIQDPNHPATRPVVKAGKESSAAQTVDLKQNTQAAGMVWKAFDEIYLLQNIDRPNLRLLLWLDKHPNDNSPDANKPGEYLISWVKSYGKGRVFYTSLGHRQEIWRDPIYQQHILGGIQFAMGTARGSTRPTPLPK